MPCTELPKCSLFIRYRHGVAWRTSTKSKISPIIGSTCNVRWIGLPLCPAINSLIQNGQDQIIRPTHSYPGNKLRWEIHPLMTLKQDQGSSLGEKWDKNLTSLHWLGLYWAASAHGHTTANIVTGRTRRWKRKTVPEVCTLACLTFFPAEVWAGCWGAVTQQADVCGTGRKLKSSFCGDQQWGIVG